jgi:hypothetical protein
MAESNECKATMRLCLTESNQKTVQYYQVFIKTREKKIHFNKEQTINRIIKEWAEDRALTLEVIRRDK